VNFLLYMGNYVILLASLKYAHVFSYEAQPFGE